MCNNSEMRVYNNRDTCSFRTQESLDMCPIDVTMHKESVEITNKMQPCNRIYYSDVY